MRVVDETQKEGRQGGSLHRSSFGCVSPPVLKVKSLSGKRDSVDLRCGGVMAPVFVCMSNKLTALIFMLHRGQ